MKSRYTAIYLAILLGWIGGHKFYLGNYRAGAIYALFSWTGVPLLISLIESMIMFSREQIVFDERYNGAARDPRSIGMPNYASAFIADNIPSDERIVDWSAGRPGDTISFEVVLIITSRRILLYGKQGFKERSETLNLKAVTSIDKKTTAGSSEIKINSGLSRIEFRSFGKVAKSEIQKLHNAIESSQLELA